jgi:hypothetical protein
MAESPQPSAPEVPSRLTGADAWRLHLTLACGLLVCVAAFWFELARALGGNALSWAYVFEWPLLGIFAIYMWWQLLHPGAAKRPGRREKQLDPAFDEMRQRWEASQSQRERDGSAGT